MNTYPTYKNSGVPWLGEIPAHWEVYRLKEVSKLRLSNVDKLTQDGEGTVRLCNYVDVYKNDFVTDRITFMKATATSQEIEDFSLQRSDVLITKDSESWNDIGVPAVVASELPGVLCGYHLAMIRPDKCKLNGEFLMRSLSSPNVATQFHVSANGITRYGVSLPDIKSAMTALPPLDEQAAIVKYLAHADRKIDRFIQAKRRMIELLNEQKQGLIHQAVTKGLDPDVPMKVSGVAWLGEIPAHWEVVALMRVANSWCDGPFGSGLKSSHYSDTGVRVVRLQNIGYAEFRDSDAAYIPHEHYTMLGDHDVHSGDLLIAGLGDERISAGRAAVAPDNLGPAMVKADCFRFRLDTDLVNPGFLALHLTATAPVAAGILSTGATRQRVNLSSTAGRWVALPPMQEQYQIDEHIQGATRSFNSAVTHTNFEIDLIREYRTRLVSDVVTGKVDVREVAVGLPDIEGDGGQFALPPETEVSMEAGEDEEEDGDIE